MPPRSPGHVILLVVLGLLGSVAAAAADTITWTGAVNVSWHDPGNWDLERAPGPGDDVVIPDLPGTPSVTYAAGSTSIQSLACDEIFILSGGTLNIAGPSTIGNAFTLSGLTTVLTGAGNVTINGNFTWSGGTISGSGTTKIGSASVWTVSGPGAVLTRLLESEGQGSHQFSTVTLTAPAILRVRPGSTFVLESGGTAFSGTGAIQVQTGALLRSTIGGSPCVLACALVNVGTVRVETGTLQVNGGLTNGGTVECMPGSLLTLTNIGMNSLAGSTITAGGAIRFMGGTSVVDTNVNFSVAGQLQIGGSGTLTLNRDLSVPYLIMFGGTLAGSGHLTVTTGCDWTGGTMSGAGLTTFLSGVIWSLGSNGVTTLSRTLENSGGCTASGGVSLTVLSPGVFINRTGGTVDMLSTTLFAGAGQVRNEAGAIIRKTAGVGATSISSPLLNDGLLRIETGTLRFTAAVTNNGTIESLSGSLLRFSTNLSSASGSALAIGGSLTFDAGTSSIAAGASAVVNGFLTISFGSVSFDANCATAGLALGFGGTLQGSGLVTAGSSFDWSGGTMAGPGTTTISAGAIWAQGAGPTTLARLLVNQGTCNYTGAAITSIGPAGTLRVASGGVLDLRSDASFAGNAGAIENLAGGLIRRTTSTGRFTLSSPLVNSGEVRVVSGSLNFSANLVNATGGVVHGLPGTHVEFGAGAHSIGAGSTLDADDDLLFLAGTTTVNAAAIIAVGDTLSLDGALASVSLGADLGVSRFVMNAGALSGAGNLTVNNTFSWAAGTMSGTGFTRIAPGAAGAIVATGASPTLDRLLLNDGACSIGAAVPLILTSGALIRSGPGATFTLPGNNGISGSGAVENQAGAQFVKSGGGGTSVVAGTFTNLGTIRVLSGKLQLSEMFTNEGTVEAGDGAGPVETLEAVGGYRQLGGLTHLVSGTLVGGPIATPTFVEILGGLVTGNGRLEGLVTNSATFAPGDSIGGIEIGGDYVQTPSGRLEAQVSGAATPGVDYDRLQVTGNATLGGELLVSFVGGFAPASGDSFDVVSADPGAVSGTFATSNLPMVVAAGCVQLGYEPDAVRIRVGPCVVGLITWTGEGGTTSWHDAANWSLHRSPIAGDAVRIPDLAGTPVVVYSTGATSIQDLDSDENLTVEGGNLDLAGLSLIAGTLTLSGGALSGTGDLALSGAFVWSGSGAMNGPGTTSVESTGSWTVPAGASPQVGRTLVLRGTGLNAGTLAVPAGLELRVDGGSLSSAAGSSLTVGGTLAMLGGTLVVNPLAASSVDSLYAGAGSTVTLDGDGSHRALHLDGGLLGGAGDLTLTGSLTWSSGTMSGAGSTRVAASAAGAIVATGATPTLDRLLLNDGACSLGGSVALSLGAAGVIRNGAGATFSLPGDNGISGSGAVENQAGAQFVKSGGVGTSVVAGGFTQLGTLRVLSGTLQLAEILTNEGTVEVGDGAGPAEKLEAQGGYRQIGGLTHLASGTLVGGPVGTPTFVEILGGSVTGTGRLEGLVTNSATFAPGDSIGGIEIGGDYVQASAGRLEAQVGDLDYDRLEVTGNATLGGELLVSFVGGFEAASGDSFDVVSAGPGAVSGAFANTNLPMLVAAGCVQLGYVPSAVWIWAGPCGVGLITWTGEGGTTNWHDADNWSLHRSPVTGDFVRIPDLVGTPVVVYSSGTTSVQGLDSDENLAVEGGVLDLVGGSVIAGALTLSGGAVSGTGDLVLSGAFEWSGSGAMNGPGTTTVDSTGSWTVPAGATPQVGRTLVLRGSGLNSGTLAVPAGLELRVDGGSLSSGAGSSLNVGGTLAMFDGTLAVDSLASCSVDSLYAGAGSTVTLDGDGSHRALLLEGGFLGGAGDLTFTGSVRWKSGTLSGTGRLIVPAGLAWRIDASAPGRVLGRTIENHGACVLTGGAPTLIQQPGGSFRVESGGELDLQGDAGFAGNGGLIVQPGGRLVKSAGVGASTIGVSVSALGVLDANSGTLAFTAPGPFSNQGAVTIGAGAALAANAGYVQAAGSTVLAGGTLSSAAGVTVQGGSLRGSGAVAGNLVNMAQLAPGDLAGAITVAGNFTQTAAGQLNETVGGHVPGSGFDVLVVSGSAQVGGSLVVTLAAGFVPSSQDTFAFLAAGSVAGQFAFANLPISGAGFCLDLEYRPGLVRLSTLGIAIFQQPAAVVACPQGAALFSVSAAGPGTPAYQWRRNGAVIPGANNDTLVVSPVTAGNAGSYDVVVVTACDSAFSLAVSLTVGFCPDTLFVDASKPAGGNGAAWATAYRDLQAALSAAAATGGFCEVWVARGRYRPDASLQAVSFNLVNKVALYGGFLGNETQRELRNPAVNRTVLSGDLAVNDGANFANNLENSRTVVRATGVDSTAILDGFVVTGGNALANGAGIAVSANARAIFRNCAIDSNFAANSGAGFRSDNSSPRLVDCTLRANRASGSGGGLSASGTGAVTVTGGSFTANVSPGSGGAITLSTALSISGTQFVDNTAQSIGGAINLSAFATSVLSLSDCGFTNNSTTSTGGGIGGAISVGTSASVTALRCNFAGNTCNQTGAGTPNTKGGAIGNLGVTMTLTECTFTDNAVRFNGAAVANACGGGAVFGPALMDRCTFLRNETLGAGTAIRGGAVHVTSGVLEIRTSRFVGNRALAPAATPGGAVAVTGATRFLAANCLFDGNTASGEGGAVYLGGTRRATLTGCTVYGNTSVGAGGGLRVAATASGDSTFVSSGILWLNVAGANGGESAQVSFASATAPKVNYSDVFGLTGALGGVGNVAVEPLFSDANGPDDIAGTLDDDFTLRMGSPVVDAGDNASIPAGAEADLAGAPRRVDDPCRVDTGAGSAPIVDMGALEFQGNSCALDVPIASFASGVTFVGVPAPNPTTGPAEIRMRLPRDVAVKIDVMDVAGRRIHTLLDAVVPAGERTIRWDGRGDSGQLAHAGLYFVRFRIGSELLTRRVLIRP